jgi:methionyl-tRNA formyltransferase
MLNRVLAMPLRLIFMGTPDFAVPTLVEIVGRGHEVVAVYTRPAKRAGRGMTIRPSPVARAARSRGLRVRTPSTLRTPRAAAIFRGHHADAAVVIAYGLILPRAILNAVPRGCFNLHASLLPRWRGAAPINRAVMAGDAATSVTVMKMDEGLDTGPVVMAQRVPIDSDMTAGELHDRLKRVGARLMVEALDRLEHRTLKPLPKLRVCSTYASKIDKAETRIDWTRPWKIVHDQIRGLSPFPGAWFEILGDAAPIRVKVLRSTRGEGAGAPGTVLDGRLTIACGEGAVRLLHVQRADRQPMEAEEFLRGTPLSVGAQVS